MRRREFIAGLGSAAAWPLAATAAWPTAARAQQAGRVPRLGVLVGFGETDPEGNALLSRFNQGLAELGWVDGRNLLIDVRWAAGNFDRVRMFAKELVDLQPDVIFASGPPQVLQLKQATQIIPIVFASVADPIGAGLVASLARPGGNLTGFATTEASLVGKGLQLLTEIARSIKRAAIIFNPETALGGGAYYLPSFEAAARSLSIEPVTTPVRSDAEIEAVITSLGGTPGNGLVGISDTWLFIHRAPIISLTARNKVPAVYAHSSITKGGGLLSYGVNYADIFHRAATYVDRILRGTKPSDLPVQLPVKFEMAVNVKTAKALGLTVPQSILLRADEVIE